MLLEQSLTGARYVILTLAAKHYVAHNSIYSNNQEVYFEREWRRAGKNATAKAVK